MDIKKMEQNKKEMSLKSMYFNRFLIIRYAAAIFLFSNLYWFVLLAGVGNFLFLFPLVLLILGIFMSIEQVGLLSNHKSVVPKAKRFFISQLIANILLLGSIYTPLFPILYPFLSVNTNTRILSAFILILGILICLAMIQRIKKIEVNKDVHYKRVMDYQNIIK